VVDSIKAVEDGETDAEKVKWAPAKEMAPVMRAVTRQALNFDASKRPTFAGIATTLLGSRGQPEFGQRIYEDDAMNGLLPPANPEVLYLKLECHSRYYNLLRHNHMEFILLVDVLRISWEVRREQN
jgi:hypothetical protein